MKKMVLIILSFMIGFYNLNAKTKSSLILDTSVSSYDANDLLGDVAFNSFDIVDNKVYAVGSDNLNIYNKDTGAILESYSKISGYSGFVSFTKVDPANENIIWVGYTTTGNVDDRIYKFDKSDTTWTHVATFKGNFDMDFYNGNYYISGLNTESSNAIWLLDTSGANNHDKLIQLEGYSSGLGVATNGDIYYVVNNSLYRWSNDMVLGAIGTTELSISDGVLLSETEAGANDVEVDIADHVIFNGNTSYSYLALWNGQVGNAINYDYIGIGTSKASHWFSTIASTGDITKPEGKLYQADYYSFGFAEIFMPENVIVSTFDDLTLPNDSYWNGSDQSGGFSSNNAYFHNHYNTLYNSWDGFSYSNMTDSITAGHTNQYSAYVAHGVNGSANYGVSFVPSDYTNGYIPIPTEIDFVEAKTNIFCSVKGMYVTNTTYATLSMKNGDDFAKKFGGNSGNDKDWFLLTISGIDQNNLPITNVVKFYLADYRFDDNSLDYIVNDWQWVDLTPLGDEVKTLKFTLTSSDVGDYGMNTPAYFAIDDLKYVKQGTSEIVTDKQNIPENITLYQNYPNPFNPETTIKFDIKESQFIELSVYNYKGEFVKNILKGYQNSGTYEVKWNGKDKYQNSVATGTYFYRLKAKNYSKVMRALLIK